MDQRRRRAGGYNPSVAANRQQSSDARWSSALRDVDGNVDPAIQPTHAQPAIERTRRTRATRVRPGLTRRCGHTLHLPYAAHASIRASQALLLVGVSRSA